MRAADFIINIQALPPSSAAAATAGGVERFSWDLSLFFPPVHHHCSLSHCQHYQKTFNQSEQHFPYDIRFYIVIITTEQ